jgi:hypothetical protein
VNSNGDRDVSNTVTPPIVESPINIPPIDDVNYTNSPPLDDNFSITSGLMIVLGILVLIGGGILSFVLIKHYDGKKEETNQTNSISAHKGPEQMSIKPEQLMMGNKNYWANARVVSSYRGRTINALSNPDAPAINYVSTMRQKGVKDEVIIRNLRNRGWSEDVLRRVFK